VGPWLPTSSAGHRDPDDGLGSGPVRLTCSCVRFVSYFKARRTHAYTTVFVVAVVIVALTLIPAAFLPKKPVGGSHNELGAPPV